MEDLKKIVSRIKEKYGEDAEVESGSIKKVVIVEICGEKIYLTDEKSTNKMFEMMEILNEVEKKQLTDQIFDLYSKDAERIEKLIDKE